MSYFTKIGNVLLANGNVSLDGGNITSANITLQSNGNTFLGSVANLKISGGSSGQTLITDGSSNLSWANILNGTDIAISGSNSVSLQSPSSTITASGGNVMITGNLLASGATFTGNVGFTANISAANIAASSANLTGNIVSNNILAINGIQASANSNIAGVLLNTGGDLVTNDISTDTITANIVTSLQFVGNASGITNVPAGNIVGSVNNNVAVTSAVPGNVAVGNIVTINLGGVTYQLLAR